jgi:hypothetical protein
VLVTAVGSALDERFAHEVVTSSVAIVRAALNDAAESVTRSRKVRS